MWSLIIVGGGIMVVLLGPFTIQQFGDFHWIITSGTKVSIRAIFLIQSMLQDAGVDVNTGKGDLGVLQGKPRSEIYYKKCKYARNYCRNN